MRSENRKEDQSRIDVRDLAVHRKTTIRLHTPTTFPSPGNARISAHLYMDSAGLVFAFLVQCVRLLVCVTTVILLFLIPQQDTTNGRQENAHILLDGQWFGQQQGPPKGAQQVGQNLCQRQLNGRIAVFDNKGIEWCIEE